MSEIIAMQDQLAGFIMDEVLEEKSSFYILFKVLNLRISLLVVLHNS